MAEKSLMDISNNAYEMAIKGNLCGNGGEKLVNKEEQTKHEL